MSSLRYVGPPATAGNHVLTSATTNEGFTGGVSQETLDSKVATAVSSLVDTTYVQTRDGLLVNKSYVDTGDSANLLTTSIGAANGVAPLNSSGQIDSAYIPSSAYAMPKILGPYLFSWVGSTPPDSYYDGSGRWDQFIGSITIPAPGGSGLWRPLIFGRFEVFNVSGRTDIFVTDGTYELARGCGRNGDNTQAYPVTVMPRADAAGQTPGGWNASTGKTLNFFVSSIFMDTRGGVVYNGAYRACAFVVRIS